MSQFLPYDEIENDKNAELEDLLSTPDDSNVGHFTEVDLKDLDNIKDKTKNLPSKKLALKIHRVTIWLEWNQRLKRKKNYLWLGWWKCLSTSLQNL